MNPKLAAIFSRRSVRQYARKDIPEACIADLLEAAMAAPSACAKDPWEFIVLRDRQTLAAVAAELPNGRFLADAGIGMIVCGDLSRAHAGELSYLLQDCSAAVQNLLLAASALGLGACWLGVHPRQERVDHIRRLFALPDTVLPVAAVAIGWPIDTPSPRTRFRPECVHVDRW